MRAAILESPNTPLSLHTIPDPTIGTGEVLVDIVAAPVFHYTNEVLNGTRKYLIPTPSIPGCSAIGQIRQTGPDSTTLQPGDWVFCDPTVRSRDSGLTPDIVLQGWTADGPRGQILQKYHQDGPFASCTRIPTENAIPIGAIERADAGLWCAALILLIPYGGLRAMDFRAGETLLVSGATGSLGSATLYLALAMGARQVIATGRNGVVLAQLRERFGERVVPVKLSGEAEADIAAMRGAAAGRVDCVLDFLPPAASASVARSAIMAVRPYGRVVLMGGVGMLGGEELGLPYPWIMRNCVTIRGQWMYEPTVAVALIGLIRSGLVKLSDFDVTEYSLEDINKAVDYAAETGGPFKLTVVRP